MTPTQIIAVYEYATDGQPTSGTGNWAADLIWLDENGAFDGVERSANFDGEPTETEIETALGVSLGEEIGTTERGYSASYAVN